VGTQLLQTTWPCGDTRFSEKHAGWRPGLKELPIVQTEPKKDEGSFSRVTKGRNQGLSQSKFRRKTENSEHLLEEEK